MRLYAARSTENANTTVEHLQRTVNFDSEVHVPGRIDDVQTMSVPLATGRSGLDSNAALLLLVHEVGGSRAIVHFTDFVNLAGEFQDPLGCGGFTGINVGKNADIPIFVQVSHLGFQFKI